MAGWRQAQTSQQKFPRQTVAVAVRVATVDPEIDPDSGESFFRSTEATTANLSRGGAFIHSWEPLAAGRRVIVALDMPSGGELSLLARVVWTRRRIEASDRRPLAPPGYGIEFIERNRAEQAALQQILNGRGPDDLASPNVSPLAARATAPSPVVASEPVTASSDAGSGPPAAAVRFTPGP